MSYTIMIDEEQREILVRSLRKRDALAPNESLLLNMLEDLPEQEAEAPGNLHGFCL